MKIIPITEPREGFIYENNKKLWVLNFVERTTDGNNSEFNAWLVNENITEIKGLWRLDDYRLIGKLGITHRIEDNKLVEIPRRKIEVGDVFKHKNSENSIIVPTYIKEAEDMLYFDVIGSCGLSYTEDEHKIKSFYKKIGIMGVNFTIDWSIE